MSAWQATRETWDRDVRAALGYARTAVAALVVTGGVRLFQLVVANWQVALLDDVRAGAGSADRLELCDTLATAGSAAEIGMLFVVAGVFLYWLSRTIRVARALSPTPLRWSQGEAVWGFFVPFLNLVRPYQVIRDLFDQLAPDAVPEPAPQVRFEGAAGYRSLPVVQAPPPLPVPHASIGLWWALFLVQRFVGYTMPPAAGAAAVSQSVLQLGMIVELVAIACVVLAVLVVRAVAGRLAERHRRVSHASDEELEAWGIPS
jgi:hypothetical protein